MNLDTRDGRAVATMMGNYLNGFFDHNRFYQALAQTPRPAHNFIVLILYWCHELQKVQCWDKRNEQSVLLAGEIVREMGLGQDFDWFGKLQHVGKMEEPVIPMPERGDSEKAAYALSCHLNKYNLKNSVYKDFVSTMLQEHRTIQQYFTRFCRNWCRYVVEQKPLGEKGKSVRLATWIAENQRPLPMI